ncbi:MAG: DUF6468 domain-containing protein [Kiloniellales bacterium]|nr:DUF6468 domain-containing protein [Kiloniellales bacterium]
MSLSLIIDAVVILLLLATIGYAAVLNRRLIRLRSAKDDMAALLKEFGEAGAKAQQALAALHGEGQATAEKLDGLLERARSLSDDLVFLIDRGDRLADSLAASEAGTAGRKPAAKRPTRPAPVVVAGTEPARDDKAGGSAAALFKSLQGMR